VTAHNISADSLFAVLIHALTQTLRVDSQRFTDGLERKRASTISVCYPHFGFGEQATPILTAATATILKTL
jgi:hypothetical protein